MSTSLILLDGQNNYIEKPYISRFFGEDSVIFSSGTIVNLNNSRKSNLFEPINIGQPITISEKGEFYLQIKFKPLTNQIDFCKILNDEELEESNKETDSLLNIVLPIARIYNATSFSAERFLNSAFIVDRESSESQLNGYYDSGNIYLSSALVKSPDSILIKGFTNQDFEGEEGSVLAVSFSGVYKVNLDIQDRIYSSFEYSSLSISSVKPNNCQIKFEQYDGDINDTDSPLVFNFLFTFPIGIIEGGNYIHLNEGEIKISLKIVELRFFEKEETLESGCRDSVYRTITKLAMYPSFPL